ncbi:MAG: transposase, partial [Methanotrichaceae archaeon]|nr:transposase [Methanotrichaceae archaeon]
MSYNEISRQVPSNRKRNPYLSPVHSQVLQDILIRLDKSFKAFFRRVKAGEEPGYPRFNGKGWYKSFTYSQTGYKLEDSKLTLSKIGSSIRIFKHREVEGKIKTDKTERWYAVFVAEQEDVPLIEPQKAIGVDVGIQNMVTISTGETIQYPRYYVQAAKKLATAQRGLSRKKNRPSNRQKARIMVARLHKNIQNLRDDFLHKAFRKIVDSADLIILENLNINKMVKNHHLARHIQDHTWGKLIRFTQSKAERAGKSVVLVDPRNTSQNCSGCGTTVLKVLAERTHSCPK